jgi:spore germination cell wall hydrolase CwlJ-like protein
VRSSAANTRPSTRDFPQRRPFRKARACAVYTALMVFGGCQRGDVEPPQPSPAVSESAAIEQKADALEQNAAAEVKVPPPVSEMIKPPEAQRVDPTGAQPLDDALTCLARSIYWEARGEATASMEAVANVVMNRLADDGFPKTICEVVTQGQEQGTCQFSWWCDGRPDHAYEDDAYAAAKEVARKALNLQLHDRVGGALYFHHHGVSPGWAATYVKTAEVGEFMFYKPG